MEFIDPPAPKTRPKSKHWPEVVDALKKNPGQWGLAGNYSIGVATHVRNGRYVAFFPDGETDRKGYMESNWEVTTRNTSDGRNDLYIRWVGSDGR